MTKITRNTTVWDLLDAGTEIIVKKGGEELEIREVSILVATNQDEDSKLVIKVGEPK